LLVDVKLASLSPALIEHTSDERAPRRLGRMTKLPPASRGVVMGTKTFTGRITLWSVRASVVTPSDEPETFISCQGPLDDRDRVRVHNVELSGFVVSFHRRFIPHDPEAAKNETFKLGPNPFLDVAPGEKRPLGVVSLPEDILDVHLFPHESVFNELITRNVYGGPMPCVIQFDIYSGGEVYDDAVDWSQAVRGQLPVVNASLTVRTSIEWPDKWPATP
jgi:hypothetical protein